MLKFFIVSYRMKYFLVLLALIKVEYSLQMKEICASEGTQGCLVVTPEEEKLLNEPFYIDANGVKINWTDPNDGWSLETRLIHLKSFRKMEYQRKHVPRFTKLGMLKKFQNKPKKTNMVSATW